MMTILGFPPQLEIWKRFSATSFCEPLATLLPLKINQKEARHKSHLRWCLFFDLLKRLLHFDFEGMMVHPSLAYDLVDN